MKKELEETYLKISESSHVKPRNNMDRCPNGQKQLKLVNRMLPVPPPPQTPDLEDGLQIQKNGESNFNVVVPLVENLPWAFVVFEMHGGCDDTIS